MARLSLAANAGDLAVPVLLAGLAWFGLGWRAAFTTAGALATILAFAHACERRLDVVPTLAADDDEDHGQDSSHESPTKTTSAVSTPKAATDTS